MMYLILLIGVLMISVAMTYAMWIKIRVIWFRQDVYEKSASLFDLALKMDALSDPAYQQARKHLHSLANIADDISIPMLIAFAHADIEPMVYPVAENEQIQKVIDEVYAWSASRLRNYLMKQTLCGGLSHLLVKTAQEHAIKFKQQDLDNRKIEQFVRSNVPMTLSQLC